jgi:two-component system copper resistance phosphate regulon response regulator CusR
LKFHGLMKILIIEDESNNVVYLTKGLKECGYSVNAALNGEAGLQMAKTMEFDLLILDVMLPDRDGWSILKNLRESGNQKPVLFLTARDSVEDRVKGLELGADDYLVKPFAFSELLARVRSLLRRGPSRKSETARIADLEIDPVRHKATRAGQKLDLTPKEFGLLHYLASHSGEVLSRTLIAEQVWDMNFDSDTNIIEVHVRRLRSKMDDPFNKKLIHTVRGVGYTLEDRN